MKIIVHQMGFILSMELRKLLYHQICDEFETSYHEIEKNLSKYVDILKKIKERGDWTVAMSVQGEDVEDPSLLSLELLEKSHFHLHPKLCYLQQLTHHLLEHHSLSPY